MEVPALRLTTLVLRRVPFQQPDRDILSATIMVVSPASDIHILQFS